MYTDRPRPGAGYLVFATLLVGVVGGAFLTVGFLGNAVMGVAGGVLVLLYLWLLHAAFSTRYEIEGGVLRVRAGFVFRKDVPLADIATVERVQTITRVVGWGARRFGACNRLADGVRLEFSGGALFVSPVDCAAFIAALNEARGADVSPPPSGPAACAAGESGWKTGVLLLYTGTALLFTGLSIPLILGRVPPNASYGFRTAATLADPALWYRANAVSGWCELIAACFSLLGYGLLFRYRARLSLAAITALGLLWFIGPVLVALAASWLWLRGATG